MKPQILDQFLILQHYIYRENEVFWKKKQSKKENLYYKSIPCPHVHPKILKKMWPSYWFIGGQVIDSSILTQKSYKSIFQNAQKLFYNGLGTTKQNN